SAVTIASTGPAAWPRPRSRSQLVITGSSGSAGSSDGADSSGGAGTTDDGGCGGGAGGAGGRGGAGGAAGSGGGNLTARSRPDGSASRSPRSRGAALGASA